MKTNKIIGIGFHKTGTSTLRAALEILNYSVLGPRTDLASYLIDGQIEKVLKETKDYEALEDNPWAILYKELDQRYPNSKFILTIRDEQKWIGSVINHFGGDSTKMREYIYGKENGDPTGKEKIYLDRYRKHIADVKEYFKDRPEDLLILSWEKKPGWEPICKFLQVSIPRKEFPHVNKGAYTFGQKSLKFAKNLLRPLVSKD